MGNWTDRFDPETVDEIKRYEVGEGDFLLAERLAMHKGVESVFGFHVNCLGLGKPDDSFFKPKRRRKVRCTETGVVYESIKDAAERTKISPNGIGSAASGMAGGYHWEYADD